MVYDTKSNRFYEAVLDEKAEVAEFCLLDKATGEPILLTRVKILHIHNLNNFNIMNNNEIHPL